MTKENTSIRPSGKSQAQLYDLMTKLRLGFLIALWFASLSAVNLIGLMRNGYSDDLMYSVVGFGIASLLYLAFLWYHFGQFSRLIMIWWQKQNKTPENVQFLKDIGSENLSTTKVFDKPQDYGVSLSFTDKLTGLGNRERLRKKFEALVQRNEVSCDDVTEKFAMGLIDLDGIQDINAVFGRWAGDEIIKQCAMRFQGAMEGIGHVMRIEGGQFSFLLPREYDSQELLAKGNLLIELIEAPCTLRGRTVRVKGRVALGVYPDISGNYNDAMENMNTAINQIQKGEETNVSLFSEALEERRRAGVRLEHALINAIDDEVLMPHFQPIIALEDGKLLGFEALARWHDEELGTVSPVQFIHHAEERGIIRDLTESMLRQSLAAASNWPSDLYLSFNLSSLLVADQEFLERIKSVVDEFGFEPGRLEFEVTETAVISNTVLAEKMLTQLHEEGYKIAIDDFGTGHSSLERLHKLKFDKVKLDRAFINDICTNEPCRHIAEGILNMCSALGLKVVSEGIENVAQARMLRLFGSYAAQGHLFGMAQCAQSTLQYIADYEAERHLTLHSVRLPEYYVSAAE